MKNNKAPVVYLHDWEGETEHYQQLPQMMGAAEVVDAIRELKDEITASRIEHAQAHCEQMKLHHDHHTKVSRKGVWVKRTLLVLFLISIPYVMYPMWSMYKNTDDSNMLKKRLLLVETKANSFWYKLITRSAWDDPNVPWLAGEPWFSAKPEQPEEKEVEKVAREVKDKPFLEQLVAFAKAGFLDFGDDVADVVVYGDIGGNYVPDINQFTEMVAIDNQGKLVYLKPIKGQTMTQAVDEAVNIGKLSAKYESEGLWGIIGRDSTGGYSYGKYQIATGTGTFRKFMVWLKQHDRISYDALMAVGGNKAAKAGNKKFIRTFKKMAKGQRFQNSQHAYIVESHYQVLVDNVRKLGVPVDDRHPVIKDVWFSTAVQHGGGYGRGRPRGSKSKRKMCNAERILTNKWRCGGGAYIAYRPYNEKGWDINDETYIRYLYKVRGEYFGRSTKQERKAVRDRFKREMKDAVQMLKEQPVKPVSREPVRYLDGPIPPVPITR